MRRCIFQGQATGLARGETAVIKDHASIWQGATQGGTGKETGDRHPKVRKGALIGAGDEVPGNIEVGEDARIAAGSAVLSPVAANTTEAGVPARVAKTGNEGQSR